MKTSEELAAKQRQQRPLPGIASFVHPEFWPGSILARVQAGGIVGSSSCFQLFPSIFQLPYMLPHNLVCLKGCADLDTSPPICA